uniref:Uncharacterized protein n=1 Tax=Anguilla anguilla TaxID=7936 RepID=A0A0E9W262_ANGAN
MYFLIMPFECLAVCRDSGENCECMTVYFFFSSFLFFFLSFFCRF